MFLHRFSIPIVISVLLFLLAACSDKASVDPRTETPLVRTATVQVAVPTSRSFTGTVAARVQSDLGFRVSGKVLERRVDAGQTVKRGQLLMRIDPVDLKLAAVSQESVVAAARARAQQAANDEARYRELRGTGAISVSAYDQAKAAADAANAQLNAATAQYKVASNSSGYAELVADGDGIVMETLAEPGQVVGAGQPVVRLAHSGQREAIIQLPETLRPAIGSVGEATLFGTEGVRSPAKLRQLSDTADKLTRTFEARYVLEGEIAKAPLGTTVTIQLAAAQSLYSQSSATQSLDTGNLQVPIGAIFDAGKGPGVWLVSGEPAKVSWRSVAIQHLDDDSASITSALKQGDKIVALGAHLLHDGEPVRLAQQVAAAPVSVSVSAPVGAGHE